MAEKNVTIYDLIYNLSAYWEEQGCLILQPMDVESGAGTFHPATFIEALTPHPWRAAYVSPARRPRDGRYGENPHRLYQHFQFQAVLKPTPNDILELYLYSLEAIGIKLDEHDLRFDEDDWESPTLGAWGLGWQVLLDGMEITQFTYFQQMGGRDLPLIMAELTYGLERIAMYLAGEDSLYDIPWGRLAEGGGEKRRLYSYDELRRREEYEQSVYAMDFADVAMLRKSYDMYEKECERVIEKGLIRPAHDYMLKCSHAFNLLDSRAAIGVTERAAYIGRIRKLSRNIARLVQEQYDEGGEA
ncbi:MAG: glycine--tRNA ligase subunit alpha [bacterium]|nr:glycine--tRNA ligase subunit alpha [bacterium]